MWQAKEALLVEQEEEARRQQEAEDYYNDQANAEAAHEAAEAHACYICELEEEVNKIPKSIIMTVAESLDSIYDFAGDSNVDNLKIWKATEDALKMHSGQGSSLDEIHITATENVPYGIEVHTTVRDRIWVYIKSSMRKGAN